MPSRETRRGPVYPGPNAGSSAKIDAIRRDDVYADGNRCAESALRL